MEHSDPQASLRQYEKDLPLVQSQDVQDAGLQINQPAENSNKPGIAQIVAHVNALAALLAGRADCEGLLAQVVAAQSQQQPEHVPECPANVLPPLPGRHETILIEPEAGMPFEDMQPEQLKWCIKNGSPLTAVAAKTAFHLGPGHFDDDCDGNDVAFVRSVSWSARDAALREGAVSLPSSQTSPLTPQQLAFSKPTEMPPAKPQPTSPSSVLDIGRLLLDPTNPPDVFKSSPDVGIIRKVLSSPVDFTLSQWFTRALCVPDVSASWAKWSDPTSPPHRDAPDALAAFAEAASMDVPRNLLSPDPDVAADAWDGYRGLIINAFNRALVAGADWRQILRHLVVRYKSPTSGHPRLCDYVGEALQDTILLSNPPLHCDVIIRQLDDSFSANTTKYRQFSMSAEWDKTNARRAGEDCLSLARRVIKAYVRKLNDASTTAANVFENQCHMQEINKRFADCLQNDSQDAERGWFLREAFDRREIEAIRHHEIDGEPIRRASCMYIAQIFLGTQEQLFRLSYGVGNDVDHVEPQEHSIVAPSHDPRHRSPGKTARQRRTELRRTLGSHEEE